MSDIVVEGFVSKQIYPQKTITDYEKFAIFVLNITNIVSGSIDSRVKNKWYKEGSISLKGPVPELNDHTKYRIEASLEYDQKYGFGYVIQMMNIAADLETRDGVLNFLSYILPPSIVDVISTDVDRYVDMIEKEDIKGLCSIKGVGEKKANDIIKRYNHSKSNGSAYAFLRDYGLTKYMIDKLIDQYKSPDTVVRTIRNNPYTLITECRGVGWSKADTMALSYGIEEDSAFRIKAYAHYYLTQLAETDGHTWVPIKDLASNLFALSSKITKERLQGLLKELVEEKILFYNNETKQIGLYKYRVLEEGICDEIKRLQSAEDEAPVEYVNETILECEEVVGFKYTEEQVRAIKKIVNSKVSLLTANAGCVDSETEYFNGCEWKKISEYTTDDLVLQYNQDGTASLTKPLMYIKKPCNKMYHFETKHGLDQTLSEEHNVIYWDPNGVQKSCSILDIRSKQDSEGSDFPGKFKTSFIYDGNGIDLTDNEIRIMCAVICGGSFYSNVRHNKCKFHIKTETKKEALRQLFSESGIWWKEVPSLNAEYADFYIDAPRREKEFANYWYNCSQRQLRIVCENVVFWNENKSATTRKTADFIQFAYSACGYRALIREKDRRKTKKYSVEITDSVFVGVYEDDRPSHIKTKIEEVMPSDGYKYCFMVESTMLVLRRKNNIFVTGNCGKTSLMYPVTRIFRKNGIDFSNCALSGKASLNLKDVTLESGSTIHKLLGYIPELERFVHNKNNQLEIGAVILDEVSMVGGELFYSLISSIKTGSKLIMIGDPGQLESIGLCNLISDFKNSGAVTNVQLTKIFRQAEMSGIITDSIKVYNQQPIFNDGFSGHAVHGELQDFDISVLSDSDGCLEKTVSIYKDLVFGKGISAEDVIILTAKRAIGQLSAVSINKRIQDLFNFDGECLKKDYTDNNVKYEIKYHIGDRIIVTKNDYNAFTVNGKHEEIFNGNIGTVVGFAAAIDCNGEQTNGKALVVRLMQGDIIINESDLGSLQLGYAITTAKSQGSGFKYAISVCDPSAYMMLTKEFLYTEITRAKKMGYLVGTNRSISTCIKTTNVIKKQTWLCDLLNGTDKIRCN